MWIAKTATSDGILVVVFAAVLFLILLGIVGLVKWTFRKVTGKSATTEMEEVVLVLDKDLRDRKGELEEHGNLRTFASYLHSKLAEEKIGQLAGMIDGESEMLLCFAGPDAGRIWDLLKGEVREYSPTRPMRVILERAHQNGGTQALESILWQSDRKSDCPISSDGEIPRSWLRLSRIARTVSLSGIIGLFEWNALRMYLGKTDNEFGDTGLGMFLGYSILIVLISGLSLSLICSRRLDSIRKAAGFFDGETPTSDTLKYVLLAVIAIFGLIFILICSTPS